MARSFESWDYQQINETFGLSRVRSPFIPLSDWLSADIVVSDFENLQLSFLKNQLSLYADEWNEDELKFMFIGPLLSIINFNNEKYKVFTQRQLTATVDGVELNGIVDFMIASGAVRPTEPYFFLHEYKQEKRRVTDPLGQLLAEMIAARSKNKVQHDMYGCYVMGRFWFFVVLRNNEYAVSNAYNASDEGIFRIVSILKQVKEYINIFFK